MSAEAKPTEPAPACAFQTEPDIAAVIYKAKGDARAVIRMMRIQVDMKARDHAQLAR
jgi:hypothetical protein